MLFAKVFNPFDHNHGTQCYNNRSRWVVCCHVYKYGLEWSITDVNLIHLFESLFPFMKLEGSRCEEKCAKHYVSLWTTWDQSTNEGCGFDAAPKNSVCDFGNMLSTVLGHMKLTIKFGFTGDVNTHTHTAVTYRWMLGDGSYIQPSWRRLRFVCGGHKSLTFSFFFGRT